MTTPFDAGLQPERTELAWRRTALALALDGDRCHPTGGVLTPSVAMGEVLVERLRAQGFRIEVGPTPTP